MGLLSVPVTPTVACRRLPGRVPPSSLHAREAGSHERRVDTRLGHSGTAPQVSCSAGQREGPAAGEAPARTPSLAACTHRGAGETRFQQRLCGQLVTEVGEVWQAGPGAMGPPEKWVQGTGEAGAGRGRRGDGDVQVEGGPCGRRDGREMEEGLGTRR